MGGKRSIKRVLNELGVELTYDLVLVKIADALAQNPKEIGVKLESLSNAQLLIDEIVSQQECFTIKDLKVNGKDLMTLGIPQGKQIGEILNHLLDMVLEDSKLNSKEFLLEIVEALYM